ncbi:unnamed protein product [Penicillium salamii]|nr:unnamed protein product [Penicillium salamii]
MVNINVPTYSYRQPSGYNGAQYDERGYDERGYDERGYDERGYDERGYDESECDESDWDGPEYDGAEYDGSRYDGRGYEDVPPSYDSVFAMGAHGKILYDAAQGQMDMRYDQWDDPDDDIDSYYY